MKIRKTVVLLVILVWVAGLAFLAGPVRWELANTYAHVISDVGNNLPMLTMHVALPLLGLSGPSPYALAVQIGVGCWLGLGLLVLAFALLRAKTPADLGEWLLYGGTLYCSVAFLFAVIFIVSLLLPWGLL